MLVQEYTIIHFPQSKTLAVSHKYLNMTFFITQFKDFSDFYYDFKKNTFLSFQTYESISACLFVIDF